MILLSMILFLFVPNARHFEIFQVDELIHLFVDENNWFAM